MLFRAFMQGSRVGVRHARRRLIPQSLVALTGLLPARLYIGHSAAIPALVSVGDVMQPGVQEAFLTHCTNAPCTASIDVDATQRSCTLHALGCINLAVDERDPTIRRGTRARNVAGTAIDTNAKPVMLLAGDCAIAVKVHSKLAISSGTPQKALPFLT